MHLLRSLRLGLLLGLSVGLGLAGPVACAGSGGGSGGSSFDPITQAQMEELTVSNAHEAVQRLRPAWLRHRGAASLQDPTPSLPVVYVDGSRRGSIEELERISVSDVEEIRYLPARDATTRFGTGHAAGVIEVRTRR
jgi:hypothetical protein